jgi:hypothetical protein
MHKHMAHSRIRSHSLRRCVMLSESAASPSVEPKDSHNVPPYFALRSICRAKTRAALVTWQQFDRRASGFLAGAVARTMIKEAVCW